MSQNSANASDLNLWADSLGLLPIPVFSADPRPTYVMLNGPTGNFCLDLTGEISDKRAVAWSADVGHYVSVAGNNIDVQRWDASPSVSEKYSARSVVKRLSEFHTLTIF